MDDEIWGYYHYLTDGDQQEQASSSNQLMFEARDSDSWRAESSRLSIADLPRESSGEQQSPIRHRGTRNSGRNTHTALIQSRFAHQTVSVRAPQGFNLGVLNPEPRPNFKIPRFYRAAFQREQPSCLHDWVDLRLAYSSRSSEDEPQISPEQIKAARTEVMLKNQENEGQPHRATSEQRRYANRANLDSDDRNYQKYQRGTENQSGSSSLGGEENSGNLYHYSPLDSDDAELLQEILAQIRPKRIHVDPQVSSRQAYNRNPNIWNPTFGETFDFSPNRDPLNLEPSERDFMELPLVDEESYHSDSQSDTLVLYVKAPQEDQPCLNPNQRSQACQTEIPLLNIQQEELSPEISPEINLSFFPDELGEFQRMLKNKNQRIREFLNQPLFDIIQVPSKQEYSASQPQPLNPQPTKRRVNPLAKPAEREIISTFEGSGPFTDFEWNPPPSQEAPEAIDQKSTCFRKKKIAKESKTEPASTNQRNQQKTTKQRQKAFGRKFLFGKNNREDNS